VGRIIAGHQLPADYSGEKGMNVIGAPWRKLHVNPPEQASWLNNEPRFFPQLSNDCFFEALTRFNTATRKRPQTFGGGVTALDKKKASLIITDHSAGGDNNVPAHQLSSPSCSTNPSIEPSC
jgi:hypothetical protein